MDIQLTVDKATPSSNGGFILKLVNHTSVTTAFGGKEQTITYYMKVATKPSNVKPGFKSIIDLDEFVVVNRDFEVTPEIAADNPNMTAGDLIPLKWLQLKPATA